MKETNMEHYRGEIEAILNEKNVIAISKLDGSIFACKEEECHRCICMDSRDNKIIPCDVTLMRWLMSEYKPEPVLTQREKHFVEFAETGWLARDIDGVLNWFMRIPDRNEEEDCRCWNGPIHAFAFKKLNELFPFITWEDEEPWSVESLRKLKVQE